MLHLLDASLEQYLRGEVPLDERIDVSYEAPDNEWRARVTRPTINLFVWDIRRNQAESQGGMDLVERGNGKFHRPTPPRVDFRYLITTWTSQVQDEHSLLGSILVACLRTPLVSVEYLQGGLAETTPVPRIQVARFDGAESSEFWASMGGQLKASLDVIVTCTVDSSVLVEAGPPVRSVELGAVERNTATEERLFAGSAGRHRREPTLRRSGRSVSWRRPGSWVEYRAWPVPSLATSAQLSGSASWACCRMQLSAASASRPQASPRRARGSSSGWTKPRQTRWSSTGMTAATKQSQRPCSHGVRRSRSLRALTNGSP